MLGGISGTGTIEAAGKSFDEVPYEISVSITRLRKSGAGHIRFSSIGDANEAFMAGRLTLKLENGKAIELVPKRWNGFEPLVEVLTSGPIPGF